MSLSLCRKGGWVGRTTGCRVRASTKPPTLPARAFKAGEALVFFSAPYTLGGPAPAPSPSLLRRRVRWTWMVGSRLPRPPLPVLLLPAWVMDLWVLLPRPRLSSHSRRSARPACKYRGGMEGWASVIFLSCVLCWSVRAMHGGERGGEKMRLGRDENAGTSFLLRHFPRPSTQHTPPAGGGRTS